jgi:hypothetical protein
MRSAVKMAPSNAQRVEDHGVSDCQLVRTNDNLAGIVDNGIQFQTPAVEAFNVGLKWVLPRASLLAEQDFGHHPLILVIEQMTVKYRHTLDDGVGEVQDHINGAAKRNIHGIQPRRMR